MKRLICTYWVLVLLLPTFVWADAAPKIKRIELQAFTQFTLDMVPDLGTRFIFPFVLDEESDNIPFTLKMTNPVFTHQRVPGRNFFVVELPPMSQPNTTNPVSPVYLGNLFINAGGYNITVLLRSSNKTANHITDVVFELSDESRQRLIQDAVDEQLLLMTANFKEKERALDTQAHQIALRKIGRLVLEGGDTDRIAEENTFDLRDGSQAIVVVNRLQRYADFRIVTYELFYDGEQDEDLIIRDVQLYGEKSGAGTNQLIPSVFKLRPRLQTGESVSGFVATDQPDLAGFTQFTLAFITSQGNFEMIW